VLTNNFASASNKKLAQATAQQKDGSKTSAKGASEGMNNLKIDDTPLPKSKNLDVIREFKKSKAKKSASFVVVGESLGTVPIIEVNGILNSDRTR
jgi:elongation factor 1 alpha-like protein